MTKEGGKRGPVGGLGSIRTPPPFRALRGGRERRGQHGPLPLVGGEGVSRPLCSPSSPLGRASFSAVAPATPTPGSGYPLVRLPICLSLMLTRASRRAAPEGVSGWRGPCLPSRKHWGSGIPASRSRTSEPPRDRVPSSLPALHPGLSAQCRPERGGIPPGPRSDHARDGGNCETHRPWERLLLGVPF